MISELNQNPEQQARDKIDAMLLLAGWHVQSKKNIDFSVGMGVAIREYQTSVGPADYVLFVNHKPLGLLEAKKEDEGHRLTVVEEQSKEYATADLKFFKNTEGLKYIYESTGVVTRFTDIPTQSLGAEMFSVFISRRLYWNGRREKKV
ncbi:type I restriction endonuclease [Pedobacter agri]|uniref:type I restriction endonuclease n=1 Tax=Pedobacter agri TaxID=454586 RepID=UPI00293054BE|nr:type I restriction endonuclease [Pedobacter agri]